MFRIEDFSSDIVVEKNTVKNSKTGIEIGKQPEKILLRKNSFENVENKYKGEGIERAIIIPLPGKLE